MIIYYNNPIFVSLEKQIKNAMTADEKTKLFNAIGYDETRELRELPEEYVAIKAHFKLNQLEVFIRNDDEVVRNANFQTTVVFIQVKEVSFIVEQRPAAGGLE